MTQPEKLWCCNFQTEKGGWEKGWGGYARPDPRHPLDDRERNTGAEYVRVDVAEAAMKEARESALREAANSVQIGDTVQIIQRRIIALIGEPNAS